MLEIVLGAGGATTLLLVVGWLARTWIKERLIAAIHVEAEQNLDQFRSDLKSAEARVTAVSSAGIGAISQMANASFAARVNAIQTLWNAVILWNKATAVSQMVAVLSSDYVRQYGGHPGTRDTFRQMLDSISYLELLKETGAAESARPFVSPRAWALFFAYHSLFASRITKAASITISHEIAEEMWARLNERDLVATSAPREIIAQFDDNAYLGTLKFLEYLKEEMVSEFRRILSGEQFGPDASASAASIIGAAGQLLESAEQAPEPPMPIVPD